MKKIACAYINVHDKTGLIEIAGFLYKKGVEILAAAPLCKVLEKNGIKAVDAFEITRTDSMLDGSLDGLHPAIMAGILADRMESAQIEQLKNTGARRIDLVIVSPAPVEMEKEEGPIPPAAHRLVNFPAIDITSIALMRAAAKNHRNVAVLCSPDQYSEFIEEFSKHDGAPRADYVRKLALRAFEFTASYDMKIYNSLFHESSKDEFLPDTLFLRYAKAMDLRYGENPHQKASFFKEPDLYGVSLGEAVLHKGTALTYSQVYDLNMALEIVMEFDKSAVAVVKQGLPLGVALDKDITKAYMRARDVEAAQAAGAVVAFNGQVEKRTAKEITNMYSEAIIASRYTDGALDHLKTAKKSPNMRILQIASKKWTKQAGTLHVRSMLGGVLAQENDDHLLPEGAHLKILSKRKPTRKQLADVIIAWKVCKHVGSNAVVLAKDLQTIGTSANQINRLEAMKIALDKAGDEALGCVMAFDTFIPFRNVIDEAARYGITAIIQPGGALRDDEIIMACDEHNISLAMTGMRHLKH